MHISKCHGYGNIFVELNWFCDYMGKNIERPQTICRKNGTFWHRGFLRILTLGLVGLF